MSKKSDPPKIIDAPVRVRLDEISAIIERSPRPAAPLARYQKEEAGRAEQFTQARRMAQQVGDDPAAALDAQANVLRTRLARLRREG